MDNTVTVTENKVANEDTVGDVQNSKKVTAAKKQRRLARKVVGAIGRVSSPRERKTVRHCFYPSYRSQFVPLLFFGGLSYLAVLGRSAFPGQVIEQTLLSLNEETVYITVPLLTLPPLAVLIKILFKIFNARYVIDKRGVESQVALLWLSLRQARLRFEDIKGIEVSQSLLERFLDVGTVTIGSAAAGRDEGEVLLRGVAKPKAVQRRIQRAIDRRKSRMIKGGTRVSIENLIARG